jgi:hypothetical protein
MPARLSAVVAALSLVAALASCASPPPASAARSAVTAGAEESARLIAALFAGVDYRAADPRMAAAAEAGELERASAAWWGFDPKDSTRFLEAALASGAGTLLVPAMGEPWRTGPLRLRSRLRLVLEPGASIVALEGAFVGSGDCLLDADGSTDLEIVGYGAGISMRKKDYAKPPYADSQWRHAIALRDAARVRIAGLRIEDSGGDGVYVGQRRGRPVPEDILLEDLTIRGNYRQGISVISARGLRILRCEISGTAGHLPAAGIDFEPNSALFGFEDCLVGDCRIYGNAGPAVLVYLGTRSKEDSPVSIELRDCELRGSPNRVYVGGLMRGARGTLSISGLRGSGLVAKAPGRGFLLEIRR